MSAVLSDLGIRESRNDILTMSVIVGINSAMHFFRSQVGNGSSSHDLAGDSLIISLYMEELGDGVRNQINYITIKNKFCNSILLVIGDPGADKLIL